MTIPPSPGMTPSAMRLGANQLGKFILAQSLSWAKEVSMKSMGTLLQSYKAWKMVNSTKKKITKPHTLWVSMRSNLPRKSVALALSLS